ncbi:MAG: hypothetical protein ACTSXK_13450 [Promethearchaeota archaeon]
MPKHNEIQNEMVELGVYALMVRGQGEDLLMGTDVKHFRKIHELEKLLHHFILDLDSTFSFIYDNDIAGYLNSLEDKFHIDLTTLQENLATNITEMQSIDSDEIMIYYLVITKTLEQLRKAVFENEGQRWAEKIYKKIGKEEIPENFLSKISTLELSSNEDCSLIYNLIFTSFLAKIYRMKSVQENCEHEIVSSLESIIKTVSF